MLLHIIHKTSYQYSPAAENAHHMVHLKPASGPGQQLLRHALVIDPLPLKMHETMDVYGNTRTFFSIQPAHDRLTVVAESAVATGSPAAAGPTVASRSLAVPATFLAATLPWEQVRERFRYRAGAPYDSACEFLFASPLVPWHDAFMQFARPSFAPGRPLAEAAGDLMERIHDTMQYDPDSTEVHTPALQALRQGKGVCQDFAHIMVACCRAMGLPARYVSGYLLTQPPPGQARLIGSDASHAWASVYCPGASSGQGRWLDFDPTNKRTPGEDYVTLAIGRDFLDVSPMRGVIRGGAQHQLEVAVTVQPWATSLPASDGPVGAPDAARN